MNVITFFITSTQTPLMEQPVKRCFDNIAKFAKAATIFGVTSGNQWFGLTLSQRLANLLLSIIGTIREHFIRPPRHPIRHPPDAKRCFFVLFSQICQFHHQHLHTEKRHQM